jgi:nucleoside-diphosphate-sugar epimerase
VSNSHSLVCEAGRFIASHRVRCNIVGAEGSWTGGKEKAPTAICTKVATAKSGEAIEIWTYGEQTRSFFYIDDRITD